MRETKKMTFRLQLNTTQILPVLIVFNKTFVHQSFRSTKHQNSSRLPLPRESHWKDWPANQTRLSLGGPSKMLKKLKQELHHGKHRSTAVYIFYICIVIVHVILWSWIPPFHCWSRIFYKDLSKHSHASGYLAWGYKSLPRHKRPPRCIIDILDISVSGFVSIDPCLSYQILGVTYCYHDMLPKPSGTIVARYALPQVYLNCAIMRN